MYDTSYLFTVLFYCEFMSQYLLYVQIIQLLPLTVAQYVFIKENNFDHYWYFISIPVQNYHI